MMDELVTPAKFWIKKIQSLQCIKYYILSPLETHNTFIQIYPLLRMKQRRD